MAMLSAGALRFWTNNISPEKGKVIPKHAYAAGVVRMERNKHAIVLHPGRKMLKYFP